MPDRNYAARSLRPEESYVQTISLRSESVRKVLFVTGHEIQLNHAFLLEGCHFSCTSFENAVEDIGRLKAGLILVEAGFDVKEGRHINRLKEHARDYGIPFMLFSKKLDPNMRAVASIFGFDDYYSGPITTGFLTKAMFLKRLKSYRTSSSGLHLFQSKTRKFPSQRIRLPMRVLDVLVASALLILLLPVLLIIGLLIKLESPGPVFYVSKRAGRNYRVFDFYKFRSMRDRADSELSALAGRNQYGQSVFFKIQDDPRVTPLGRFLRQTSLDELPQLMNVLKGDMSLVGNRPLPLYEAERLTCDKMAWRFLAPAGITGLWQITKRGKREMSEEERIRLDVQYAQQSCPAFDFKILLGTLQAFMQRERV